MPSPGGVPGAPPPGDAAKRCESLSTVCLVLASLEALSSAQRLSAPFTTRRLLDWERSLLPRGPGAPPVDAMMDRALEFSRRIAPWELVRALPFLIMSGLLFWIGVRLRRGEMAALASARTWAAGALGVVALSTLIQVLVVVPATLSYQRAVVAMMPMTRPGGPAPPFDFARVMSAITLAGSGLGVLMGAVVLAAWPVVLLLWARKLSRPHPAD
jgi:hypothetical protein